MSPIDIKILLLRAEIRQADIAREYGCSCAAVNHVVAGRETSRPIQRLIARKLGIPVNRMFPRAA